MAHEALVGFKLLCRETRYEVGFWTDTMADTPMLLDTESIIALDHGAAPRRFLWRGLPPAGLVNHWEITAAGEAL